MPKFLPAGIEFAVVSAGGVATTSLIEFFALKHHVNTPSDEDGFKHMPIAPVSFNPDFRYVFVFGCPVAATVSLFRRGYHALQSRKLQRGYKPYHHIPLAMTLEEYAAQGEDRLGFERQFLNYYDRHLIHPTLFVRYDSLWSNLDTLADFLCLDRAEMKDFPPRLARKSEELVVPKATLDQLYEIYRPFITRLNGLPEVFIRGEKLSRSRVRLLFTKNFHTAVKNGIVSRFKPVTGPYGE